MEPVTAPLRVISRKFLKPLSEKKAKLGPKVVSKNWLRPTVANNGAVWPPYLPMLWALQGLTHHQGKVESFRAALREQDLESASTHWLDIKKVGSAGGAALGDETKSDLHTWKQLAHKTGSYGPRIFVNALNDISRRNKTDPGFVRRLIVPSGSALDPFILGYILSRLANYNNIELAMSLLNPTNFSKITPEVAWSTNAMSLGLTALLDSSKMESSKVVQIVEKANFPPGYKLPSYLVSRLANYPGAESVHALKAIMDHGILPPCKATDKLLRRVYSASDYGGLVIRSYAVKMAYPWQFYPFLVRRLCERLSKDESAKSQLDHLFDHEIAELASTKPSLVLHLLVLRIIATDGVQATSPVLNRWVETDGNGVSEATWMLLFQAFRRMGRPDKCSEVLDRVLKAYPKLSLPFIGEYLLYIAQFCNLETYIRVLLRVIPEMRPLVETLGITEYVSSLPLQLHPAPLQSTTHNEITAENRDFFVHRIHESWLAITYQAVLATAEATDQILQLFERYLAYVTETSRNPATSLRVVDQFVMALCSLPREQRGVEAAEYVYRSSMQKLRLKSPVDGKNHSKSLGLLCYKLAQDGQSDNAVRLLVEAVTDFGVTIRATTLEPWVMKLPPSIRHKVLQWARHHAGVIITENDLNCEIQDV